MTTQQETLPQTSGRPWLPAALAAVSGAVVVGLLVLLWFGLQLYSGVESHNAQTALMGGVAWWSHVGGFLFGLASGPLIAGTPRRKRLWR